MPYPEILLPKRSYPILSNEDIADCALVRETPIDLYPILSKRGYTPDDIVRHIVAPNPSFREIFELSVFLYGYYHERYTGIRVVDSTLCVDWTNEQPELRTEDIQFEQETVYPLFLKGRNLDRQEIDFNDDAHLLSFSHKPSRVNYWHCQLWTQDSAGNRIPRDKSNAHTRNLAKSLLEYIAAEAVCSKPDAKRFKREDFDVLTGDPHHVPF
ncbi:hypothetical protein AGMMS49944_29080 [Spirochaetia bacterium]|nr:hypothetical protein AGMMS49944_29080 [Spirochaetia bacterium]